MDFCSNCATKLIDGAKFCQICGAATNGEPSSHESQRQQEYAGKILKCPNCGEVLKSFEGVCPACGHEINSAKMSVYLKEFVDELQDCDRQIARSPFPPKKGFSTWSKRGKFWWIVLNLFTFCIPLAIYLILPLLGIWWRSSLLPEEKRKAALIKNHSFPNDRANVLEILLFIKTQMAFIASEKIDRSAVHWANIWGKKAEQVYQKSEIIIKGDTIAASVYNDIVLHWKKIKKSFCMRVSIALSFIVILIVARTVGSGPFGLLSNPLKSISNPFVETFEWPTTELSRMIPQPESDKGEIWNIDAESLHVEIKDITISQFESYIKACKERDFSVREKRQGNTYEAYNNEGYYLKLSYTDYSSLADELSIQLKAPKNVGELQWPSTTLTNIIPNPESSNGEITHNDEEKLWLSVYDFSESKYEMYLNEIKNYGFTIDSETNSISYKAYNENGYYITIYDESNQYDWSELFIVLEAPMKMESIRWPQIDLVKEIPKPKSKLGRIDNESRTSFTVYIGNTTPEEYDDYVDACVKKGFTKGLYSLDEIHFHGDNSKGSTISVDYIGFNIMKIEIYNYDY